MFTSLANRNFRIYFSATIFSVIGTFGQELAQAWLVLSLTHSATALGLVVGLQFLPMLVLGPWGGLLADRFSRRRILIITQSIYALLVFGLWAVTATNIVQVWMIDIFALLAGINGALNTPTRLGFLHEVVGEVDLHNAVSLNATVYSTGRVLGPAIAGILIALLGVAPVFLLNGLSYLCIITALGWIRTTELRPSTKSTKASGQLRAGLRYIKNDPVLKASILMTLIVGIFTYEFPVTLPALAKITFHGDATTLAILSSSLGLGSVVGGLLSARLKRASPAKLPIRVVLLGLAVMLTGLMPRLWMAGVVVFAVGFATVWFSSLANSTVQLSSLSSMRGRTLGIWTSAWVGSTAIGGPLIGWVCEHASPSWGLIIGGIVALAAAGLGYNIMHSDNQRAAHMDALV